MRSIRPIAASAILLLAGALACGEELDIAKSVVRDDAGGKNLLGDGGWRPYDKGFVRDGDSFVCDNSHEGGARRGVTQLVELNQTTPAPIIATASSKAEGVDGHADGDYALYLDLIYTDGTPLWGQIASFSVGTHDWQKRQVVILPEKPVKSVSYYLLLRGHNGKAWFRDAELHVMTAPQGACLFDGVPVMPRGPSETGFQVRDVAADSDFVRIHAQSAGGRLGDPRTNRMFTGKALGIELTWQEEMRRGTSGQAAADALESVVLDVADTTGKPRAITLVFAIPIAPEGLTWFHGLRESIRVEPRREYSCCQAVQGVGCGRLSRYPLGAVGFGQRGTALSLDASSPVFGRIGYNSGTGELFLACDIGLTPEKAHTQIRLGRFPFASEWGFRGALARYYEIYPDAFRCRTPQQGVWMPFAKISAVPGWQDFGFKFKEGNDETAWDDQHGILTFRYTEPMTWWMAMPKGMPRSLDAAMAEAKRLADKGDLSAKALLTSGYHDAEGRLEARFLDTPWCNGAVWSINSSPQTPGETTDFKNKWNAKVQRELYPAEYAGKGLDGEYVDSSEGYVTGELDYRAEHLAASGLPLVFSASDHRPAIFRGTIATEYVRGIAADVHAKGRLMMANGTPSGLWWLAPMLDVMGTETDWNPAGKWQPMSDAEMLYRRAMCKGKPYCFLMNTRFEQFSAELVEKYMKRSLAYGMFPGFFSANASEGHYFTRPELYDRDRPLFQRFVPLCKRVAEAGWEPITLARTDDKRVYVERFGDRFLTVFNDSPQQRSATIRFDGWRPKETPKSPTGHALQWHDGKATIVLEAEDVAVLEVD